MFSLMSQVVASALLTASTLTNPTTPSALSFEASAYVTNTNQIRVAVQKSTKVPVVVLLRNRNNEVLFHQNISKRESTYAVKLDVNQLADGQYELEIKSSEGSIRKHLNLSTAPVEHTSRLIAVK